VLQALSVVATSKHASIWAHSGRCLWDLMCQLIDASLILWQDLEMLIELCFTLPKAALWALHLHLCISFNSFLSRFINICIISLIHHLRNCILLGVHIFNLQFWIGDDYQILNHRAKIIWAHHEIFLCGLLADIKQQIGVSMHILLRDLAGLSTQELRRYEYLLLVVIHSKHSKSKTGQDRFAAQLKTEYRNLMDTGIQTAFSIQIFLCLLAAEIALARPTQDTRVFGKVRGISIWISSWLLLLLFKRREILSLDLWKGLLTVIKDHDLTWAAIRLIELLSLQLVLLCMLQSMPLLLESICQHLNIRLSLGQLLWVLNWIGRNFESALRIHASVGWDEVIIVVLCGCLVVDAGLRVLLRA